ncbi:hypothetical protein [Polaribacter sp.]|uniref:hypothetical protein n=1 Tax=Polaribacter sp. TaxID=1920175 RepID=UPI004047C136
MKNLEMNQMEFVNGGGWSWKGCAGGGVTLLYAYGKSPAVYVGGWWGVVGAAAVGCIIGGVGAGVS